MYLHENTIINTVSMIGESFFGGNESMKNEGENLERAWKESRGKEAFFDLSRYYFRSGREEDAENLLMNARDLFGLTKEEIDNRLIGEDAFREKSDQCTELISDGSYEFLISTDLHNLQNFHTEFPSVPVMCSMNIGSDWEIFKFISEEVRKNVEGIMLGGIVSTQDESQQDDEFQKWLSDKSITQFRRVDLAKNFILAERAAALAKSEHVGGWREVDLSDNYIGAEGAAALAKSEHVGGWRKVNFGGNYIGAEGASALARSEYVAGWRDVDLGRNDIGSEGAAALARSEHVAGWRDVGLWNNNIGSEGASALARSEHVAGWRDVGLGRNNIGYEGTAALARSEQVAGWREVDLWNNNIGDEGAVALATSEYVAGWKKVNLAHNPISDQGLRALRESPNTRDRFIW